MKNNPLFSKESLESAASFAGETKFRLLYRSNKLPEQIQAGEDLRLATFVLATIIDHIFDYRPYSWFMNDEESNSIYPKYLNWFKSHLDTAIDNAVHYVNNDFAVLDTITQDEGTVFVVPQREYAKEEHVKAVFAEINKNREEIKRLLNAPKKNTDPSKPSRDEVLQLIKSIQQIKTAYWNYYEQMQGRINPLEIMQITSIFETFLNTLYLAWEAYHYGHHSDFWKEGDSTFEYMMFQSQAKDTIEDFAIKLKAHSPFQMVNNGDEITRRLLKVYNHLIDNNLIK